MKRAEIRRVVLVYLENFFYNNLPLHDDFPVKKQMYASIWALDMYEQLTDEQKYSLYLYQNQNDNGN